MSKGVRNLTFDQLWDKANSAKQGSNGLYYHPCCDIWTTRGSEAKRASHSKHFHWRQLISTLDKSCEDKKKALLAKMAEEDWRVPIVLNEACQVRPTPTFQQQSAFSLHQAEQLPQDLQTIFSPQILNKISPDHYIHQDLGSFYLNH